MPKAKYRPLPPCRGGDEVNAVSGRCRAKCKKGQYRRKGRCVYPCGPDQYRSKVNGRCYSRKYKNKNYKGKVPQTVKNLRSVNKYAKRYQKKFKGMEYTEAVKMVWEKVKQKGWKSGKSVAAYLPKIDKGEKVY